MAAEVSKLLLCMVICLALFHTTFAKPQVNQSEPLSMTNNNNNTFTEDNDRISESMAPQYSASPSSSSSPPAYNEDDFLSPAYPSPASEVPHLAPEYSPLPQNVDVSTAPEIANNYELSSPAPAPTATWQVASDDYAPDVESGNAAPTPLPNAVPFTYEGEDEVPQSVDEFSSKKNGTVMVYVIFAVCLVGLGGFVYKKNKDGVRKSQYEYLGKKELEL